MTLKEFEAFMCKANELGFKIEGYITIAQASFTKPYPKESRTYLVNSDNKRWQPNVNSASIWGSSLDETDTGVKLSEYLYGAGDSRWIVEDCGLVYYQLTSIYERTAINQLFNTLPEAQAAMEKEFSRAVDMPAAEYLEENEGELEAMSAWANDCGAENGNADWTISRLFNNGMFIQFEDDFKKENK